MENKLEACEVLLKRYHYFSEYLGELRAPNDKDISEIERIELVIKEIKDEILSLFKEL